MARLQQLVRATATHRAAAAAASLALACALAVKQCYAHASAADLRFVLEPSCWFATQIAGLRFTWSPGSGFVSHEARLVVAPACAGVNFLIACTLSLFFVAHGAFPRLRHKLCVLVASAAFAYPATLAANGTRIALAAWLGRQDLGAHLSHASAHRSIGVLVYSSALLACCAIATRALPLATAPGARRRYLVPLACYLAIALLVPLCRRAFTTGPDGFGLHAGQTLAAVSAVAALALVCERLLDRLSSGRARS